MSTDLGPLQFTTFLLPILRGESVAPSVANSIALNAETSVPSQIVISVCDSMQSQQTDSLTLALEPSDATVSAFFSDPGTEFYLKSPLGMLWDSASAALDPSVGFSRSTIGVSYTFAGAEPGMWTAIVNTNDATQSWVSYCVIGTASSEVVAQGLLSAAFASVDDTVGITVQITDGGTPVLNALASVTLAHDQFGLIPCDSLFDDGQHGDGIADDGIYGANFTVTVQGPQEVRISLSGETQVGAEFSRHIPLPLVAVGSSLAVGDLNFDGVHNVLDVVRLIDEAFRGASPPIPGFVSDINCNDRIDVLDVVGLINHVFRGGPQPMCP